MSDERKKILEEKAKCSSKVSDLCRYIGFGLAAVSFSILTSTSPFSISLFKAFKVPLICSAVCGIVVIVLDYMQYLSGYYSADKALKNTIHEYKYETEWFSYRLRIWSFRSKQLLAFVGAVIFVVTIVTSIL